MADHDKAVTNDTLSRHAGVYGGIYIKTLAPSQTRAHKMPVFRANAGNLAHTQTNPTQPTHFAYFPII